jgi:DNA polymerase III alpha subunit
MTKMKETEESVARKLDSDDELDVMVFFGSNSFYIHSPEEMAAKFTKEELDNTLKVADQVEAYSITHKPYIPVFTVPEGMKFVHRVFDAYKTPQEKFLLHLCIEGATKKKPWLRLQLS